MLGFLLFLVLLGVFWLIWGRGAFIVLRHKDDVGIALPEGIDREGVMEKLKKELTYSGMKELYYDENGNICVEGKYTQYTLIIKEGRLYCWDGGTNITKGDGFVASLSTFFEAFDRSMAKETEEIECIRAYILKIFDHDAAINAREKYNAMKRAANYGKLAIIGVAIALVLLIFMVLKNNGFFNDNSDDIQASYFTQYSEAVTIGEAFDNFFADPKWVDYENGASEYVDFSGNCLLDDESVHVLITFTISGERFEITSVKVDGKEIPTPYQATLIQAVYDSYGE